MENKKSIITKGNRLCVHTSIKNQTNGNETEKNVSL
jgi:hypothetical protein